jgi:hypothetical protein
MVLGKGSARAAATPYLLYRDCSFTLGRDVLTRGQSPLKKSEATNYTWDSEELGAVAAVPGSAATLRFKVSYTSVGGF